MEADDILKALEILFGKRKTDAIVDSFLSLADEIGKNFFWSSKCGPLDFLDAPSDTVIKFFKNNLVVFKKYSRRDVSDYIVDLIRVSNGICFKKQ